MFAYFSAIFPISLESKPLLTMIAITEVLPLMNEFSDVVRELLARRNLTGADLSQQIGLSENAISNIVTGKSKPRWKTFSAISRRLAKTPEERAALQRAFNGEPAELPEENEDAKVGGEPDPTEAAKIEDYAHAKALSIAFRDDVEVALKDAGIRYRRDFVFETELRTVACDFVAGSQKNRIVIDCKNNMRSDWEKTLGGAKLAMHSLPAEHAVVVVPYHNKVSLSARDYFKQEGIQVVRIEELAKALKELGA